MSGVRACEGGMERWRLLTKAADRGHDPSSSVIVDAHRVDSFFVPGSLGL